MAPCTRYGMCGASMFKEALVSKSHTKYITMLASVSNSININNRHKPQDLSSIRPTARRLVDEQALQDANQKLDSLQVHKKFADCIQLEAETKVWRHIKDGLPAGQLSFILCCSSDTLPTSTNLRSWKIEINCVTFHKQQLCTSSMDVNRHLKMGITLGDMIQSY